METVKLWVAIIIISLIAGAISAFNHLQNVDRANLDLQDAKSRLAQIKESIVSRRVEWERIEKIKSRFAVTHAGVPPLEAKRDELLKKSKGLEVDFKYLVTSMRASVEKVRADAIGSVIPEVILANKKVLKEAKLRKIEPEQVSFGHSEGFQVVNYELLPEALREKFDLGPESLALQLEDLHTSLYTKPNSQKKKK